MPKINIARNFYTLASGDGVNAELTLYGDIVEAQPTDWWGDPIEGSFIIEDEFLRDLEAVKKCSSLLIRINSAGGDAAVAILIHNRLRELAAGGMKISCVVDGVAMSGGSLIMCACEDVKVYPASIIMIHKCWSFLFGGYNADELREAAVQQDAIDRAQVGIYQRKTGLSETQLLHMMGDTTYMTGRDAVAKKFADTLIDEEREPIAASADGRVLFVHGREMRLAPGMFAPDFVKTKDGISGEDPEDINDARREGEPEKTGGDPAAEPGGPGSEADNTAERRETMTLEELREQNPELASQIDAERNAAVAAAEQNARAAERERLRGIDEIAPIVGDNALVAEARYGETACDAKELAFRAAKARAAQGGAFLAAMQSDAKASGTAAVAPVTPPAEEKKPENGGPKTMDEARADTKALLHPEN